MCDYSLQGVASRPAKVGDRLVTRQFNSFTTGFASVGEPNVAVCLLPGTEIAFDADIKIKGFFRSIRNLIRKKRMVEREARFRRVQPDQPNVHHDALELPSGETVLLTRLCQAAPPRTWAKGPGLGFIACPSPASRGVRRWRTCARCAASAECTEWLAETRASAVGPPRFCPNADLLWELLLGEANKIGLGIILSASPLRAVDHSTTRIGWRATGRDTL